MELARCEFIDRRENVIALGPSGTGKTHIALGLGLALDSHFKCDTEVGGECLDRCLVAET